MTVPVVTAKEAAALDAEAIGAGTPSRSLMQRAGSAAAEEILRRYPDSLRRGAAVFAGPGNNGGDAWVVAACLRRRGVAVTVHEALQPATDDARAEKAEALTVLGAAPAGPSGGEGIVVDGLLGTGSYGAPRGAIAQGTELITRMKGDGARVAALDLPTGIDATSGAAGSAIVADVTFSFGSVKRGQLLNRASSGRIVVLDIGLDTAGSAARLPQLIDHEWVMQHLPAIPVDAHKGDRRRVAIVGGATGMAGAIILAARAAFRSGVGLVRAVVSSDSIAVIQSAAPQAIAAQWPTSEEQTGELLSQWAHALVIGPGLGTGERSRRVLDFATSTFSGPAVIDADAINILSAPDRIAQAMGGRAAVITPHAGEMARLSGETIDSVLARRFELAPEIARQTGCVVLLKGVPTIVAAPDGRVNVSATGSPVLATGGSGDILAGILGVLIAQSGDPFVAASIGAYVHGRAGELAAAAKSVRGATLDDVLSSLSHVWSEPLVPLRSPVLAEIPAVES